MAIEMHRQVNATVGKQAFMRQVTRENRVNQDDSGNAPLVLTISDRRPLSTFDASALNTSRKGDGRGKNSSEASAITRSGPWRLGYAVSARLFLARELDRKRQGRASRFAASQGPRSCRQRWSEDENGLKCCWEGAGLSLKSLDAATKHIHFHKGHRWGRMRISR